MGRMKRVWAGMLVAVLAVPAGAQSVPSFDEIDADGDGVITRGEWMAYVDTQRGQFRSRFGPDAETQALREAEGLIGELDTGGAIGSGELGMVLSAMRHLGPDRAATLGAQLVFDRVDANDDGVVDRDEFAAGEREMRSLMNAR